ncbi:hypothetical protein [Marinobacter sp.]|uniref:hypothetical protein n=1 Tax=Marinobacter sp. TaxID=50741 RepID=UPI00261E6C31|nr:hypothetical protein [Marinobacter sp.]
MVGNSDSKTENITEEFIFNNADYGGGGGESASVAGNINLAKSDLSIGDITLSDSGAIAGGVAIARDGIAQNGESYKQLLSTSESLVGDGYDALLGTQEFAKDTLARAVNFASSANQTVSEQVSRALSFAGEADKDESNRSFEVVTKYGLLAAVVVAGAYFYTNRGA